MRSLLKTFSPVLLVPGNPSGEARARSAEQSGNLATGVAIVVEQHGMEAPGHAIGSAALRFLLEPSQFLSRSGMQMEKSSLHRRKVLTAHPLAFNMSRKLCDVVYLLVEDPIPAGTEFIER